MTKHVAVVGLFAALLWAAPARAQFSNHSLGLQIGVEDLQGTSAGIHAPAIPIDLNGSIYFDSGFEFIAHAGILVYHLPITTEPNRAALDIGLGFRYLFLQESFRPWAGLELTPLWFINGNSGDAAFGTSGQIVFLGLTPEVGAEYFVASTVSVGLKIAFSEYLTLNPPFAWAFGGSVYTSVYF